MQLTSSTRRDKGGEGETPIQFKLDTERHRRLKVLAAERGVTMRQLIVEAVEKYLDAERRAA